MPTTFLNHPIFDESICGLRNKETAPEAFRELALRAGFIIAVESTKCLQTETITVETPLTTCSGAKLKNKVVLVPILRAGLSLVPPFQQLLPLASVGHLGIKRNELTAEAECYSNSLPDLSGCDVFILDPMLATGGSAFFALDLVTRQNANSVHCVSVIAAPEGINTLRDKFPLVHFTIGIKDERLDHKFFIVPGLGDFGDRLFGT